MGNKKRKLQSPIGSLLNYIGYPVETNVSVDNTKVQTNIDTEEGPHYFFKSDRWKDKDVFSVLSNGRYKPLEMFRAFFPSLAEANRYMEAKAERAKELKESVFEYADWLQKSGADVRLYGNPYAAKFYPSLQSQLLWMTNRNNKIAPGSYDDYNSNQWYKVFYSPGNWDRLLGENKPDPISPSIWVNSSAQDDHGRRRTLFHEVNHAYNYPFEYFAKTNMLPFMTFKRQPTINTLNPLEDLMGGPYQMNYFISPEEIRSRAAEMSLWAYDNLQDEYGQHMVIDSEEKAKQAIEAFYNTLPQSGGPDDSHIMLYTMPQAEKRFTPEQIKYNLNPREATDAEKLYNDRDRIKKQVYDFYIKAMQFGQAKGRNNLFGNNVTWS